MKKILLTIILYCCIVFSAIAETTQIGGMLSYAGNESAYSLDVRKEVGNFILEVVPGFSKVEITEPEILRESDSEQIKIPVKLDLNCLSLALGGYYSWYKPANLTIYSGVKAGLDYVFGSGAYEEENYNLSTPLWNIKLVALGADLRIPNCNNLIISGGIGGEWYLMSQVSLQQINEGSSSEKISLTLHSHTFNPFGEIGIRIIF